MYIISRHIVLGHYIKMFKKLKFSIVFFTYVVQLKFLIICIAAESNVYITSS